MNRDEAEKPDTVQAFDTLFTTNHIQMYKVLLPYFDASVQRQLAIYIKYMEFQYTLTYFRRHPTVFSKKPDTHDTLQIFKDILPFCTSKERNNIEKMMEMSANLKNMQEMMDTVNMMKELFPEGFSFGEGGEFPSDMMEMFQMFGKQ